MYDYIYGKVTEQYVEKAGANPVTYKLTELGETLAKELQVDKD